MSLQGIMMALQPARLGAALRRGRASALMKCPVCQENTPDSWEFFEVVTRVGDSTHLQGTSIEDPASNKAMALDWMSCANPDCRQVVVRVHEERTRWTGQFPMTDTETSLVWPRGSIR